MGRKPVALLFCQNGRQIKEAAGGKEACGFGIGPAAGEG
jgi:hypothetical protein